ncbi:MAG TPA: hypothetical protein VJ969_01715, partial [Desulfopila sp.]|nr:hypothetical protein [Desulfopila sp.]
GDEYSFHDTSFSPIAYSTMIAGSLRNPFTRISLVFQRHHFRLEADRASHPRCLDEYKKA